MPPRRIQPPYLVPHNAAAAPGPQFAPAPALPDSLEGQRMSFQGRIDSVREIAALLKTIAFKPKCIVTASRAGLLFTVDDARCAKACAYFPVKHFRRYRFNDGTGAPLDQQTEAEANENDPGPELRFEVNLYNLMESMNVYGTAMVGSGGLVAAAAAAADGSGSGTGRNSGAHERNPNSAANKSTVLDIWYEPVEKKLVLTLEDTNVKTHVKLNTYDPDLALGDGDDDQIAPELDAVFQSGQLASKLVMSPEWLSEAFREIDPNADKIKIAIQSTEPVLRISANSVLGSTEIDYPKHDDVVERFICNGPSEFSYPMSQIAPALKALNLADRTSVRTTTEGFLCIQHLVQLSETRASFVEFFLSPLEEDEDDDEMPRADNPMQMDQ